MPFDKELKNSAKTCMRKIQTGISKAIWCTFDRSCAKYEEAQIDLGDGKQVVSWFDMLFEGGLALPFHEENNKPITFLLLGPPGSGKSTLAMELCYRLATIRPAEKRLRSLYISIDTEADRIIQKADNFGWQENDNCFVKYDREKDYPQIPLVTVWGKDQISNWENVAQIVETAIETVGFLFGRPVPSSLANLPKEKAKKSWLSPADIERCSADVLVIDSLNIIQAEDREKFFDQFLQITNKDVKLVIFILDTGSTNDTHHYWEYACDNVLKMDYGYVNDYYIRTIEVIKTRYQGHILGRHQLKIYNKPHLPETPVERENISLYNTALRRAHPYLKDAGGIVIFPSIHYYLSLYKRRSPSMEPDYLPTYPDKLNEVVKFPESRCTAFIGNRGGHKSHLAYLNLLNALKDGDECNRGLVISLRDDEGITKKTMKRILKEEFPGPHKEDFFDRLERQNRFEILYYPPGYITPEEFFHRMFMSIQRLKEPGSKLTVIFNSLDQISARFPLCAKQEIFVPGIIETLSGEGITSIFIAVDEPGQPIEQYGLLPMSDLIVSFKPHIFDFDDYKNHLNAVWNPDAVLGTGDRNPTGDKHHETIVLEVLRYSGGQRAGAKGLLELVDSKHPARSIYQKEGLHFTPLSPNFPAGRLIETR